MAANELALVLLYIEGTPVVTVPTGFTEKATANNTMVTREHKLYMFWKRATAADSGNYTFSWTGNLWRTGVAIRVSGAITTGDPFDVTGSAVSTLVDTSPPAITLTTTVAETLLVYWAGGFDAASTWTPPTGFTEHADAEEVTVDSLAQAAAGSTGAVQGVSTTTNAQSAILGAVKSSGAAPATGRPLALRQPSAAVHRAAIW